MREMIFLLAVFPFGDKNFFIHWIVIMLCFGLGNVIFRSVLQVISDLPFIHPSEVAILNRLSALGTYYMQLRDFCKHQLSSCTTLDPNKDEGDIYFKAMAYGVDKVLDAYRQELVDVEQKCLLLPELPFSHIQHEFEDFQLLLPALDSCVKYVHNHKLHGCQILSFLHQQCSSGITSVRTALARILYTCHQVFYKQLSGWMLHGLLLGQKGEFFIERIEPSSDAELEGEVDEEPPKMYSDLPTEKVNSQFQVNDRLAQSYLPQRVLEKILFIGEAVQIFQTLNASDAHPPLPGFSSNSGFQLRTDLVKFSQMLTVLQNHPVFQLREFENTIEYIRNVVAQHLWRLLVEESNLVEQLQVVKDIFLLGRGELFLSFIDMADILLKQLPTATTQHDMNVAFRQAMIKIAIDHEEVAKQFELTISVPPVEPGGISARSKKSNSWKYVGMSHTVVWPLHLVFTQTLLNKYSVVFHFLLSLRRAQVYLQQCWATVMTMRANAHSLQPVLHLRTHMGFLVDNLQYYVQVDVLETQYSLLLSKIKSTTDFEAVKNAHSEFVTTIQSQLFFSSEPIQRSINAILELCLSFSELVQGLSSEKFVLSSERQETLHQIAMDFRRQSSLLFRVLSAVKNHHSAPHISQLLLRIDYNRYFTSFS